MRRTVVLLALMVLISMVFLSGCGAGQEGSTAGEGEQAEQVQLGIIQVAEHPALDAARNGFLESLAEKGYKEGDNLLVDYKNAQGDQPTLQNIARKFVQDKKDIILAIATPSAMTMANETNEIPILITAVTDPVAAKLVKSMEKPGTNVTGTSDINPVKDQLALIKEIIPNVQKVGILYNSSEINSQVQVDIAEEVAPELGLQLEKAIATNTSEVMQAAQSLVGKVDAFYLPTDNTVISAIASVITVAEENKIPVIAGESESVKNGALATIGIDYYELGRVTGEMAARVLGGEKPQEMAIQTLPGTDIVVNTAAAERIGVEIPQSVLDKAADVIEE